MKVRDVLKQIKNDGWYELPGNGSSHRQFKHSEKPGCVTVAGHPNEDLHPKTLKTILGQAWLPT